MDVQNLTNVSTVVINSLLILLKDNHIDVNSVVMQLSNNKDEAISPEVNLGELTQQTLDELQAAKAKKVAVPEGFVLMSKEPEKDTLIAIASVCIGDEFANLDEAKELYKAVIEAQEPSND